jgi:hypothetical protein
MFQIILCALKLTVQLANYKRCLENIRVVSREILKKDPSDDRSDRIYTLLCKLIDSQRQQEENFKKSNLSKEDLDKLLRRRDRIPDEELIRERAFDIENMDLDELKYFERKINDNIDDLLIKVAHNFLKKITLQRKLLTKFTPKHKKNEMRSDLRKTQEEFYYYKLMFEIYNIELRTISNRLQILNAQQNIEPEEKPKAKASIPELPTVENLVRDFTNGKEDPISLAIQNMDSRLQGLEESETILTIKEIIQKLDALLQNIQIHINDYLNNPGSANIAGIQINHSICQQLEHRKNEIQGLIDSWYQRLD